MEGYISKWLDECTDLNLSLLLEHCSDDVIIFSCGDDSTISTITIHINDNYNITCNSNDDLLNNITSQINEWRLQHITNSNDTNITLDMILEQIAIASNNMIIDDDDNEFKDDSITYSDDDDNNKDDNNENNTMDTSIEIIILKRKLTEKQRLLRGINDDHDDRIKKQKSSSQKIDYFSPDASSLALMNDFIHYYKNGREEGLVVTAIDDDMFNWNVKINRFNYDTRIAEDLAVLDENFGYSYVEINLQFQPNVYPFYPPLVTIVRPRFEGFMLGQIASMTCLQLSHWDPLSGIKITFSEIKSQIEKYGKIIQDSILNNREAYPMGAYSVLEHTLLKLTFVCEKTLRLIRVIANDKKSKSPMAIEKNEMTEKVKTSSSDAINDSSPDANIPKPYTPWAKGTGYGSGGQKNNWDTQQYILAQKEQIRLKQSLLLDVYAIMKDNFDTSDDKTNQNEAYNMHRIIDESCLISLLVDLADTDSLLEIEEKQTDLFKVVFQIIELLASNEKLKHFLEKLSPDENSLRNSIESLGRKIAIYTRTSYKNTTAAKAINADENIIDYISKVIALVKSIEPPLHDIKWSSIETQGNVVTKSSTPVISSLSRDELEELYKKSLKGLQYAEAEDIPGYHYNNKLQTMAMVDIKNIRRLASEHSGWPESLPLYLNSSIWLRTSSQRMDIVRFIISGPEGTPYSCGLFLFDAFFTSSYPNEPPKVNLMTTGGGTVRFNPNLYNCGKVCLSLLGTWPGDNGWDRNVSTFLQVLVSIQSLILVEHPTFNEPGHEKSIGTPAGDAETARYNRNIRLQNITFAMIEMIRNPPKGFEEVVELHFRLKKEIIANETEKWLAEDPNLLAKRNVLLSMLENL